MENLTEVGKKVIDTIKNIKPADAGDLTLGIGNIIEELRHTPESLHAKLDHLEGLFRELTYGEPCGLREELVDDGDPNPLQEWWMRFGNLGGIGALSGSIVVPSGWNMNIPVSGVPPQSLTPPANAYVNQQTPPPPANPHALPISFDDEDDYDDPPDPPELPDNEYPPYYTPVEEEESDPEPKPFKKRWWNTQ